jgi:hypothetical protein
MAYFELRMDWNTNYEGTSTLHMFWTLKVLAYSEVINIFRYITDSVKQIDLLTPDRWAYSVQERD